MAPPGSGARILVVDDSPATLEILYRNLESKGYVVHTAPGVFEAIQIAKRVELDLVITDMKMPGSSGQDLIRYVHDNLKNTEVVVITGYPSVENVVQAMKNGAEEYLTKPFTDDELFHAVGRALDKRNLLKSRGAPPEQPPWTSYSVLGASENMRAMLEAAAGVIQNEAPVLIQGEDGTEKELLARAIHYEGPRGGGPFVCVNCANVPSERIDREVFGDGTRGGGAGLMQYAKDGTLLLGDIEHSPPRLQSRLAALLLKKAPPRSNSPAKKLPRIIVSTAEDLLLWAARGKAFVPDLFQALCIQQIRIPPLRERGDDVLLSLHYLATRRSQTWKRGALSFAGSALRALRNYQWPENFRELQRLVGQLHVKLKGQVNAPDLPSNMRFQIAMRGDVGLKRTLEEVEAEHIRNVLVNERNNKARAAVVLNIDRKTLREKLKRYGISE
jgi:DNA-binding NtrC family response regulator